MAKENVKLGSVVVHGIERAPRGVPKIEITMEINEDGILVVTAVDKTTGVVITATIQSGSTLSKEEISGMIAEARAHRAEDERLQKRSEWRTRLISYVDRLAQREFPDDAIRDEMMPKVVEWQKWNEEHADEESADPFIQQYFAIRNIDKKMMASS
jgi:molecular chaperone DnaK